MNLRRGMSAHQRRRVADIFKRRLLTLCSDALKCRKFQTDRNIATVDVLRDIECPFCAYWVHYLRIFIHTRVYHSCNSTKVVLYSAWASALSFYQKGNATASEHGTMTIGLHAFFICLNDNNNPHSWEFLCICRN